ncbi:MAG: DEAD/DEAH box helicase [Bacteroidales bacterium]|jgi:ATP-dependent RNA helicase DeaD|nr:DEAD/DEAH box helicase [Bacteroidales bacterium]
MMFNEMELSPELLRAVEDLDFMVPTPIQKKVIPLLLSEKRDLIGLAQTGTGKTAAFGLPALQTIRLASAHPQLLVLSPTRELCMQIARDLESYGRYLAGLSIVAVYGGASMDSQIALLKKGAHIVVATPGRIHDLIRRRRIDLAGVTTVVLDEADEMLKMGFRDDLDAILAQTPGDKNTLLFSATMSQEINRIAKTYMNDPVEITAGTRNAGAESVSHIFFMVSAKNRYSALKRIVDYYPDIYGIVFCRTRQETKEVAASLMSDGYNAEALHGDLSQAQRDYVMQKFREKNLSLLVATDVAARGLDVNNLTHIINYNLPDDNEVYTHRTGRTGRAGREGMAISIINLKERGRISQIERDLRKKFEQRSVPGGREICERQLYNMVEKMRNSQVDHNAINPYMDKVYETLVDLSREDLIKRMVSVEFNRFLEYYRNAPDLNIASREQRADESRDKSVTDRGDRKERRGRERSMARIVFNIGKGKDITKRDVMEMVKSAADTNDIEIGHIEIFRRASAVEVDSRQARNIIKGMNNMIFDGIRVEAAENYQFTGKENNYRIKPPGQHERKEYGKTSPGAPGKYHSKR